MPRPAHGGNLRTIRYRKNGRSRRLEIEHGSTSEVSLQERGESVEKGNIFACTTLPGQTSVTPDEVAPIPARLAEILETMGDDLERATIASGVAHHEIDSDGVTRTWTDRSIRLHASVINPRQKVRCEFERGGGSFLSTWASELLELREAVAAFDPAFTIASPMTLEPAVTAAVIAAIWSRRLDRLGPVLIQAPKGGARDGYGAALAEEPIPFGSAGSAWFRPSYRVRPRPIPHSIDIASEGAQPDLPGVRAIALTGPIVMIGGMLHVPCLVTGPDGSGCATLEIDPARWKEQIEIGSKREETFPLLAGVWGRRLLFRG